MTYEFSIRQKRFALKWNQAQNGKYRAYRLELPERESDLIRPASMVAVMTCETVAALDSGSLNRSRIV